MEDLLKSVSPQGRAVLEEMLQKISMYTVTRKGPCIYTLLCVHTPEWLQKHIWPPQPEWNITETQAFTFIELINGFIENIVRTSAIPPPEECYDATEYTGTVSIVFSL